MLAISIEMPSGASSMPRKHLPVLVQRHDSRGVPFWYVSKGPELTQETAGQLIGKYVDQMLTWPGFRASVVLLEDGREISRIFVQPQEVL